MVEDLAQTLGALETVFANSLSVVTPIQNSTGGPAKYMIVELGLVRLAYLQPLETNTALADFLKKRGPAVHSLLAEVRDLARVEAALSDFGIATHHPADEMLLAAEYTVGERRLVQVHSLEKVGVEFTLLEAK